MLKNEEILDQFKKSLTATTKSISQNNLLEINFTKENSSIEGNLINLPEPNIESLKKNLTYIRAEADALALEFRFHSKEIHNNFIDDNERANEIFNAIEQSRVEAKGSIAFKGIKSNITKKHILDLKKKSLNEENNISEAFKYVAYEQFLNLDLGNNNEKNRKIIKQKTEKKEQEQQEMSIDSGVPDLEDQAKESDQEYIDYKIENLSLFLKEIRLLKNS